MDVVEVSPPYDHAEITAMAANRAVLEALVHWRCKARASRSASSAHAGADVRRRRRRSSRRRRRRASNAARPAIGTGAQTGSSVRADGHLGESEALARLYDVDLLEDPGDLDLYLALAARTGGPILELGVGTGRLAVPLAAAGYRVTGVDLDPAMLARARARAAAAAGAPPRRLTLHRGDARRAPADVGRFSLAFMALNTLLVFGDARRPAAALSDDGRASRARAASSSSTSGCPTPNDSPGRRPRRRWNTFVAIPRPATG